MFTVFLTVKKQFDMSKTNHKTINVQSIKKNINQKNNQSKTEKMNPKITKNFK